MPQQQQPGHGNPQIIEGLPAHQQIVAIILALLMLLVVVELVRKRKLREEYSILWIVTAVGLLALAIDARLLTMFQRGVGAVLPTSALFFGALLFLMLVSLQYSVRLSKLTARNKNLCQKMALLERDLEDLRHEVRAAMSANFEAPISAQRPREGLPPAPSDPTIPRPERRPPQAAPRTHDAEPRTPQSEPKPR